jgi:hypothetical protein
LAHAALFLREQAMEIDPIFTQLKEASRLLSAGQLAQACDRLSVASSLLDSCLLECSQEQTPALNANEAAVNRLEGNRQATGQRALAMAG